MSRALIIACEYRNFPNARLYGCYNDAESIMTKLKLIDPKIKITYMRDNLASNNPLFPTKMNILRELRNLSLMPEKLLFFHYSGHGTTIMDTNNDEKTLLNTTFGKDVAKLNGLNGDSCMVIYESWTKLSLLIDDDIYAMLSYLRDDQLLFGFSDSCNSGTLFDLCYVHVGDYVSEFTTYDISGLMPQLNRCSLTSAAYPEKVNKTKANVVFISGSRDKQYSNEVYFNRQPCGLFTYNLCRVLDYGVENMTLRQFYFLLMASINYKEQIPVLSVSQNYDLDKNLMTNFKYYMKNPNKVMNNRLLRLLKV